MGFEIQYIHMNIYLSYKVIIPVSYHCEFVYC